MILNECLQNRISRKMYDLYEDDYYMGGPRPVTISIGKGVNNLMGFL